MANRLIALALSLSVLFFAASATWTEPTRILTLPNYAFVEAVYHDAASDVTHIAVYEEKVLKARHLAVSSNGTVLYSTLFPGECPLSPKIVIRGSGKRLFMALSYTFPNSNSRLGFTESFNNGKTWTDPKDIVADVKTSSGKGLQDMLYVAETGRIYVFFTAYKEHQLMVISRPSNSIAFSAARIVVKDIGSEYSRHAQASYTSWVGKLVLHVVYVDDDDEELKYTKSLDMGVSWQSAKKIVDDDGIYYIMNMVSHPGVGPEIYVSYNKAGRPAMLTRSLDYGATFDTSVKSTKKDAFTRSESSGLLLCGNNVLASLVVSWDSYYGDTSVEYTLWTQNQKELKPYPRAYPATKRPLSVGADCTVDADGGLNMFTAVSVEEDAKKEYAIYFTKEAGKFPE